MLSGSKQSKYTDHINANTCITMCLTCKSGMCLNGITFIIHYTIPSINYKLSKFVLHNHRPVLSIWVQTLVEDLILSINSFLVPGSSWDAPFNTVVCVKLHRRHLYPYSHNNHVLLVSKLQC